MFDIRMDKPIMGREFIVVDKETDRYIFGGNIQTIKFFDKKLGFEQPAHFHKAEALAICDKLNGNIKRQELWS